VEGKGWVNAEGLQIGDRVASAKADGSTTNSYLYTGQQYDSLAGLYSLRALFFFVSQ